MPVFPYQKRWQEKIISLILPEYCVNCGQAGSLLCSQCYRLVYFNLFKNQTTLINQSHLNEVWIMSTYQPPISSLIKTLKYQGIKNAAKVLGWMLYSHLQLPFSDYISWAPISKKRVSSRGFNQAELITLELAKLKQQATSAKKLLIKNKDTPKQAQSTVRERVTNLEGSIVINPNFCNKLLRKKTVSLIDDVVSTGSTLNECAKVLKQAGVEKVIGIAIAQS